MGKYRLDLAHQLIAYGLWLPPWCSAWSQAPPGAARDGSCCTTTFSCPMSTDGPGQSARLPCMMSSHLWATEWVEGSWELEPRALGLAAAPLALAGHVVPGMPIATALLAAQRGAAGTGGAAPPASCAYWLGLRPRQCC